MKTLKLRNGAEVFAPLVAIVVGSLTDLLNGADISSLLAVYDLLELCKDPGYYPNCFGPNRQKLLDLHLVEGAATGPLVVNTDVQAIVLSAVEVSPDGATVSVRNPAAPEVQKEGAK